MIDAFVDAFADGFVSASAATAPRRLAFADSVNSIVKKRMHFVSRRTVSIILAGWTAFLLAALMPPVLVPPASAQQGGIDLERVLGRQYDYILTCDMEVFDNYLKYKGSTMQGMVKFTVTYYPTPASVKRGQQVPQPFKYEELWFHNGKCVGQKRLNEFWPKPFAQGGIYFRGVGRFNPLSVRPHDGNS